MEFAMHNLKRPSSSKRSKKRIGRGNSSGKGTYSTRGLKGQRSRTGGTKRLARRSLFHQFLVRTPKLRGFSRYSPAVSIVKTSALEANFSDGENIGLKPLVKAGIIDYKFKIVKVLFDKKISKKFAVSAHAFSKKAKEAVEKAGGSCRIIK